LHLRSYVTPKQFLLPGVSSFMYFSSGSYRAKGCAAMRLNSSFAASLLSRCFSPPPHSSSWLVHMVQQGSAAMTVCLCLCTCVVVPMYDTDRILRSNMP
jgi:hypothetical protein